MQLVYEVVIIAYADLKVDKGGGGGTSDPSLNPLYLYSTTFTLLTG